MEYQESQLRLSQRGGTQGKCESSESFTPEKKGRLTVQLRDREADREREREREDWRMNENQVDRNGSRMNENSNNRGMDEDQKDLNCNRTDEDQKGKEWRKDI